MQQLRGRGLGARRADNFYDDLALLAATADDDPAPFAVADDFARAAFTAEEGG